jgi:hypothetical protein
MRTGTAVASVAQRGAQMNEIAGEAALFTPSRCFDVHATSTSVHGVEFGCVERVEELTASAIRATSARISATHDGLK